MSPLLYFSPCLLFHHTSSHPACRTRFPSSPPKGIIHREVEHSFKVKLTAPVLRKLCWVAPSVAAVAALVWQLHWSHLIPKPMGPWPPLPPHHCRRAWAQAINRFQYGSAGDCEWNSILFCKIVHLLDEQILMVVLAGCSSPLHAHAEPRFCLTAKAVIQL